MADRIVQAQAGAVVPSGVATLAMDPSVRRSRRRRNDKRPAWQEPPSPLAQGIKAVVCIWLTVIMLFPFVYVIAVSFSSHKDVIGGGLIIFPANPTLDAYEAIFRGGVVTRALRVSIVLTLVGTLVNLTMTTILAYGLSKPGVPGRRIVLWMTLFTLLFGPGIIPSYLLVKELNLLNTYGALVLPGMVNAFNLIVLRQFFMNIPQDLLDSARVDGATDFRILRDITLPLSKAALAVIALFYGVGYWNDFFAATLYLQDATMWPIQLVLRQYVIQGSSLVDFGASAAGAEAPPPAATVQMAVVVIATLPILLVYPFLQRYFTRGVLIGAVKG